MALCAMPCLSNTVGGDCVYQVLFCRSTMLCSQIKTMSKKATGTLEAGLPREMALSQLPPSQNILPAVESLTIKSIGVRGET
jgi:hypothetical protein